MKCSIVHFATTNLPLLWTLLVTLPSTPTWGVSMSLTILVMVFTTYISPHHHRHQLYVHIAQCANSVAMPQSETPNLDLPPTQFWATGDHTKRDRDDGSDVDERMIDNMKYENYQEHMSKHQSQGHS